jgi:hypothetical protein
MTTRLKQLLSGKKPTRKNEKNAVIRLVGNNLKRINGHLVFKNGKVGIYASLMSL